MDRHKVGELNTHHESLRLAPEAPRKGPGSGLLRLFVLLGTLSAAAAVAPRVVKYFRQAKFGEDCLVYGCRSGFCYKPHALRSYCSHSCAADPDCPSGYSCENVAGESICRREPELHFGERCLLAEECLSSLCVDFKYVDPARGHVSMAYCVTPCAANTDCPPGIECQASRDGSTHCIPQASIIEGAERRFDLERRIGLQNERDLEREALKRLRAEEASSTPAVGSAAPALQH